MSAPTWQALRDAIEKMVAYPAGDGWHISREAADKALEWIKWAEVHQPYPVPKLLPEEDEDLSLVWRSVDGWAIYRTFPKGEEPYWLAMPSRTPAALSASPEVQALIAAKLEEAVNALDGITKPAIPPGPENSVTGRAFDSGQEAAVARFKQAIGRLITPDMAQALADRDARVRREERERAARIAADWAKNCGEYSEVAREIEAAIRAEKGGV